MRINPFKLLTTTVQPVRCKHYRLVTPAESDLD